MATTAQRPSCVSGTAITIMKREGEERKRGGGEERRGGEETRREEGRGERGRGYYYRFGGGK